MTIPNPSSHIPEPEEVWWIHTKTKKDYIILDYAINEADMTPVVVYRLRDGTGPVWIRPCDEFFDGRFSQAIRMTMITNPGAAKMQAIFTEESHYADV